MKRKITPIVLGLLGLVVMSGCSSTAPNKNLRCLPCEAAEAQVVEVIPDPQPVVVPTPAPVAEPVAPDTNCLPCQQEDVRQVAPPPPPPPAPRPVVEDCLECIDGQPNYSKYQWD